MSCPICRLTEDLLGRYVASIIANEGSHLFDDHYINEIESASLLELANTAQERLYGVSFDQMEEELAERLLMREIDWRGKCSDISKRLGRDLTPSEAQSLKENPPDTDPT